MSRAAGLTNRKGLFANYEKLDQIINSPIEGVKDYLIRIKDLINNNKDNESDEGVIVKPY